MVHSWCATENLFEFFLIHGPRCAKPRNMAGTIDLYGDKSEVHKFCHVLNGGKSLQIGGLACMPLNAPALQHTGAPPDGDSWQVVNRVMGYLSLMTRSDT
jgi:hypothetical protein